MSLDQRIRSSFNDQALMRTFGAELISISPGSVSIRAPIRDLAKQQQGLAHAGLTFSLGDSAAGYSALSMMPGDCEVVTSEIKINLLAPASGNHLTATGKVIKPGKRLVIVTSEVHRDDGTLVAILQGTMVPVPI